MKKPSAKRQRHLQKRAKKAAKRRQKKAREDKEMNIAIEEMIKDGTWAELQEQWAQEDEEDEEDFDD